MKVNGAVGAISELILAYKYLVEKIILVAKPNLFGAELE